MVLLEFGDDVFVVPASGVCGALLTGEFFGERLDADVLVEELFGKSSKFLLQEVVVFLAEGEDSDGPRLFQLLLALYHLDLLVLLQLQSQQVVPEDVVFANESL